MNQMVMSYSQMAQLELMNAVANIASQEDLDELRLILSHFFAKGYCQDVGRQNPFVTIQEMSQKINVATRTIICDIEDLQSEGIIIREGGCKKGRWVIKMIPY